MIEEKITIKQLRKNIGSGDFQDVYTKLLRPVDAQIPDNDKIFLLKLAIIFLNFGDNSIAKLGYRIIVRYSNQFNDYVPLYDVTINKGYIPITKFIEESYFDKNAISERFFNQLFSAYNENFRQKDIYLSAGQKRLTSFSTNNSNNYVLVAPTSYGKSELIIAKVLENIGKKICIIVPTKALLAQTKKRLLENEELAPIVKRIITHPDMYRPTDTGFVAVLTQERLLRLLQKNGTFSLDLLLLDEAHNLLKDDSRATLLTQVILIILKRNPTTQLNYFTPFISDFKNLITPYAPIQIESKTTTEYLKIERFYICDLHKSKTIFLYDQFLNKFYEQGAAVYANEIELVSQLQAQKNIVYLNRQKHIEQVALTLAQANDAKTAEMINEVIAAIADYLDPAYNLIKCLKKGVVYHHGGIPDVIRLYVESAFSKIPEISFIVTNSTLLEGVNIPAEKIFLLSVKKGGVSLNKVDFKNLIGRVCRFSEIFHPKTGSLRMLEPEIYIIKGDYQAKNANLESFMLNKVRVDLKIEDEVENLLLKKNSENLDPVAKENLKKSLEYLENIEPNTVAVNGIEYVQTEIGQLCYKNNVYDFDIKKNEKLLARNFENFSIDRKLGTAEAIMEAIYEIFIKDITIDDGGFMRLNNLSARKFYSMIFDWRTTGSSYKLMIGKFRGYWKTLEEKGIHFIYTGATWGEMPYPYDETTSEFEPDLGDKKIHNRDLYVDLAGKSDAQRINLAILRIKEEQDYVDNTLIKYIEILNDLGLIENSFYEKLKYGSSDRRIICLLKNGFSLDLAKCILDETYRSFVQITPETDEVIIDRGIIQAMESNNENRILIFEMTYHAS